MKRAWSLMPNRLGFKFQLGDQRWGAHYRDEQSDLGLGTVPLLPPFPRLLNGDDNTYLSGDYDDDMCHANITLSINVSFFSLSNMVGKTIMLI